jgi:Flp pilus assembly protein TadG
MRSFTALFYSLILPLLLLGIASYGQTAGTGAIAGVVTDASGAVVAGATVTVTNNLTGEKRPAVSAGRGDYTVSLLPPGTYTVEALKAGCKTSIYRTIAVSVTEILRVGRGDQ